MKNWCKYFIGTHFCIIHSISLWPTNNGGTKAQVSKIFTLNFLKHSYMAEEHGSCKAEL